MDNYRKLVRINNTKRQSAGTKTAIIVTICAAIIVATIGIIVFLLSKAISTPHSLSELTITEHYDYNVDYRPIVEGDKISTYMRQATVAAEDPDFYNSNQSNLTKKVVSCVYDTVDEKKISTSVKEIEKDYNKEQILTMFLNEMSYTENISGIETGARVYFDKSAQELTLAESALLAAIPSSSPTLHPYNKNDQVALTKHQHEILEIMVDLGYITTEEANAAKAIDIFSTLRPNSSDI